VKKMYHVAVDRAAMREEILGPLFQRHVVSLSGTVDERWIRRRAWFRSRAGRATARPSSRAFWNASP
jgi:hypothetical protein